MTFRGIRRLLVVATAGLVAPLGAAATTPTVTAVRTVPPTPGVVAPRLSYDLNVEPEMPRVGDTVRLTFHVGIDGSGGLPQYTLLVGDDVLSGDLTPRNHVGPLPDTVTFTLDAIGAGVAELSLRVNYEATLTVDGQCCVYQFVLDASPTFRVPVIALGDGVPTRKPTRTPLPTATVAPAALHRLSARVGFGEGTCDSGYSDRTVELFPTGRTASSDGEGLLEFADVAEGEYELRVVPPCAGGSCFPYTPVRVAGDDVHVELCAPACTPQVFLDPVSGPPGTEVSVEGACQHIHSGGTAPLTFGPIAMGEVRGETAGDFRRTFTVPYVPPGTYEISAAEGVGLFEVTGGFPGCDGDCNGDLSVRIDEMTRSVGIALRTVDTALCPVFAQGVTVAQLVRAVRAALHGCASIVAGVPTPVATISATAAATPTPTPQFNEGSPTPTRTVAVGGAGVDLFPVRAFYGRCQTSECWPLPAGAVTVCVGNRGDEDSGPFLVGVSGRAPIEVDGVRSGLESCFDLLLAADAEVSVDVADAIAEGREDNNSASFPAPVGTQCDVIRPTCAATPTPTPGPLANIPCEQCCAECSTQECFAQCVGRDACDLVAEWSGVVSDALTGLPIAQAEIIVNGARARADHGGAYAITSVREDVCTGLDYAYDLSVRAPGYSTFVESFYRVPFPRRATRNVALSPSPTSSEFVDGSSYDDAGA